MGNCLSTDEDRTARQKKQKGQKGSRKKSAEVLDKQNVKTTPVAARKKMQQATKTMASSTESNGFAVQRRRRQQQQSNASPGAGGDGSNDAAYPRPNARRPTATSTSVECEGPYTLADSANPQSEDGGHEQKDPKEQSATNPLLLTGDDDETKSVLCKDCTVVPSRDGSSKSSLNASHRSLTDAVGGPSASSHHPLHLPRTQHHQPPADFDSQRTASVAVSLSTGPSFSAFEVAQHNTTRGCWVIVQGGVYDVTRLLSNHPGGVMAIVNSAGGDATASFQSSHGPVSAAHGRLSQYYIGAFSPN